MSINHCHGVPTVLEGESLYEAYCKLAGRVNSIISELEDVSEEIEKKLNKSGDTMTGDLDMGGNGIKGIATSSITSGTDAANKQYVDNSVDDYLPLEGGTMTGPIAMGGHKVTGLPTSGAYNAGDAIPKQYFEDHAVTYDDGLTADLTANGNTITDLAEPVNDSDAATKEYVDEHSGGGGEYVPLDGSEPMTGDLNMGGNKLTGLKSTGTVNATDAVPKWYLTEHALLDNTMTADLSANGNTVTDLAEPVNDSDAATKQYVDDNSGGVVIVADENQIVNGYQVPKMTSNDVTRAYNAVVAATPCTVTDATENQHFAVNQADTVSDEICVSVLYYDKMLLTYTLSGATVTTDYTEIGGDGLFHVNLTTNSCDRTYSQIVNAFNAGIPVVAKAYAAQAMAITIDAGLGDGLIFMFLTNVSGQNKYARIYRLNSSNQVTYSDSSL